MKPVELWMVRDSEDEPWMLDVGEPLGGPKRRPTATEVTLESMAQALDLDAEGWNAHDFVTTHRALAALLYRMIGRKGATRIFRRLVEFRGLHGLTGVCGVTEPADHEAELGVPLNNWKDWTLSKEAAR